VLREVGSPFTIHPHARCTAFPQKSVMAALLSRQQHADYPELVWIVVWKRPINGGKPVDKPSISVQKLGIKAENQIRYTRRSTGREKYCRNRYALTILSIDHAA